MKIEIWWIGKTFQDFTLKGYMVFLKRIQKFNSTEIVEFPDIKGQGNPISLKKMEAERILAKIKPDDFLVFYLSQRRKVAKKIYIWTYAKTLI
jgi:23S rRNA pseudoU1915 N3-methylase RlmH